MGKLTKKERMRQAASDARYARRHRDLQIAMNEILFILSEGTRYENDVKEAFDILEEYEIEIRAGRMGNRIF
ncbi:hypothetical protein J1907_10400 [Lysinibacillus sphaericus]|uniref:hypothetical protein n=1 Tax=Lysinibacillus sphaericus TaxID=1421 RepID=UPI00056399AE|nr:hypothetical protein [Lysinibacillus sphaericus]MBG9754971.1 hypothetical protein [Lysinibacillus sphaericus]QTB15483.1 hypothetical protein J2B92_09980 [Lysinibacillus sphaericus]QTB24416.1 hypothetical protein J1907_10400 [Lysinibacillus sphaericus]